MCISTERLNKFGKEIVIDEDICYVYANARLHALRMGIQVCALKRGMHSIGRFIQLVCITRR